MKSFLLFIFFFSLTAAAANTFENCKGPANETRKMARERLTKKLLLAGLSYAQDHSNPKTGFVEDTVGNYQNLPLPTHVRASISSTGFLMALVASLHLKGYVSRADAVNYCQRPLLAVLAKKKADLDAANKRKQGEPNPQTDISYKGWLAHFIDWETGDRWNATTEYATTDSTWFYAGGIVCAMIFPDTQIPSLFTKIFEDVDFNDLRTDGGTQPDKYTLSMSYTPPTADTGTAHKKGKIKEGYNKAQWRIYQHSWLVYLLGMGAPVKAHRLPAQSWAAWKRTGIKLQMESSPLDGATLYGDRRALFSHYFPDVFMPPQTIKEACGIDYFKNSQIATRFNKAMSLQDKTSETFKSGLWGLDAGPNPVQNKLILGNSKVDVGAIDTETYGVNSPYKRNGTACPACAVTSAMFEPDLVFEDLEQWCNNEKFGDKIWGKYGPTNGINLDYGWISPYSLSGIVGPMALSVANLDWETSVWKYFLKYDAVKQGLEQAALAPLPVDGCLNPES